MKGRQAAFLQANVSGNAHPVQRLAEAPAEEKMIHISLLGILFRKEKGQEAACLQADVSGEVHPMQRLAESPAGEKRMHISLLGEAILGSGEHANCTLEEVAGNYPDYLIETFGEEYAQPYIDSLAQDARKVLLTGMVRAQLNVNSP